MKRQRRWGIRAQVPFSNGAKQGREHREKNLAGGIWICKDWRVQFLEIEAVVNSTAHDPLHTTQTHFLVGRQLIVHPESITIEMDTDRNRILRKLRRRRTMPQFEPTEPVPASKPKRVPTLKYRPRSPLQKTGFQTFVQNHPLTYQ